MTYEPKMKNVVDSKATMADAMESMRMGIILMIFANTASQRQMENEELCIREDAEEAIKADSFVISIGDKKTVIDGLTFAANWNHSDWFQKISKLTEILSTNYCWYEDRIGTGFCWQNRNGQFCKLEWK